MSDFKLTSLDSSQITRYSFDEEKRASRVTMVGIDGLAESVKQGLALANIEVSSKVDISELKEALEQLKPSDQVRTEIQTVHVPQIVVETRIVEIEKPFIVEKVSFELVEVPVVTKEIQIVSVPQIVTETKIVEVVRQDDRLLKVLLVVNSVAITALVIFNLIKR